MKTPSAGGAVRWPTACAPACLLDLLCGFNAQCIYVREIYFTNLYKKNSYGWNYILPIGLLLFLGLTKSGRENIRSLWRKGPYARPLCMATISSMRLQDIHTMLRFDDKATRQNRRLDDKFARFEIYWMILPSLLRWVYHRWRTVGSFQRTVSI